MPPEQKERLDNLLSEFTILASDYRNKFAHHLWMGVSSDMGSASLHDPRQRTRPDKAPAQMPVSIEELRDLQHRIIDLATKITFFPNAVGLQEQIEASRPKSGE